jgi:proteasome lid subunit RPN8/RPN11
MFGPAVIEAARRHAIAEYPREACGVVCGGAYIPCANAHAKPAEHFQISADEMAAAWSRGLQAVVHSHPTKPELVPFGPIPSEHDMRQQIAHAVPFGIIATDGKIASEPIWFGDQCPIPPLRGRGFRHGVTDCCSLIRDYYRLERDVTFMEGPRDWEWWLPGKDAEGNPIEPKNLYLECYETAGFVRIDGSERQPGDVVLIEICTGELRRAGMKPGTPNHGAVYLGRDIMLHHLTARHPVDPTRLSCEAPIGVWRNHIHSWLRYRG